ncbi:MAG: hypothetical protein JWN14_3852 [Chthonomonadales bacterium]|nr:hypothetical protein [Chthonomonadales bacterium]
MPRSPHPMLAVLIGFAGLGSASAVFAAPVPHAMPEIGIVNKACYAEVGPALQSGDGKLTPEVRNAYLTWAEKTVLQELRQNSQSVPESSLADVRRNDTLRDAIFGSVYPPDPSILQNYVELRAQLGDSFVPKYRSLILAIAVAKRIKGVENADALKLIGRDYQPGFWGNETLQVPGSEAEKDFIRRLAAFMKESKTTALALYDNAPLQAHLKEVLAGQGVAANFINEVQHSLPFGERLKNAMILLGQRPADRDPKPTTAAWVRHLVAVQESRPISVPKGMSWPLFPVDSAPWPLLMSLARGVPLREADYIWETYQGLHGEDRYHTYGPYHGDEEMMPDCLKPSSWFWDAFPDRIIHGGICGPLSKNTVELYSSLGKPALLAGQPGHGNLMVFQYVGGAWTADIEQDFAGGPLATCAQWYFDEEFDTQVNFRDLYTWSWSDYQFGLALAMNLGVKSYMDTRIAANINRAMPAADKPTVGVHLLRSALLSSPFNPEIWFRLAEQNPDPLLGIQLATAAVKRQPGLLGSGSTSPEMQGRGSTSDGYWGTLAHFLTPYALLIHPTPTKVEEMRLVHEFLKTAPGVNASDIAAYDEKFLSQPADPKGDNLEVELKLAAADDAYGQLRMGQRYRDGDGVTASETRAQQCFLRAARQGDAAAGILLGNLISTVPADQIKVVASSAWSEHHVPAHLVDGSGMAGAAHDNMEQGWTMWHTAERPATTIPAPGLPASPAWVRFDFANPTKFDSMLIWNLNQHTYVNRGFRRTHLYGSTDGSKWFLLTASPAIELPRQGGNSPSLPVTVPNAAAKTALVSVIIAADAVDGNYGDIIYGLSAVRFVPTQLTNVVRPGAITVTASSQYSQAQASAHLIDGAGMQGTFHDNNYYGYTMWHTVVRPNATPPAPGLPASPGWVRFDFARPLDIEAILIWNHNQQKFIDRGLHKVHIYGSSDGTIWKPLTPDDAIQLAPGNASPLLGPTTVLNDLMQTKVKAVLIAADAEEGNYGGDAYGLSAVRFVLKH